MVNKIINNDFADIMVKAGDDFLQYPSNIALLKKISILQVKIFQGYVTPLDREIIDNFWNVVEADHNVYFNWIVRFKSIQLPPFDPNFALNGNVMIKLKQLKRDDSKIYHNELQMLVEERKEITDPSMAISQDYLIRMATIKISYMINQRLRFYIEQFIQNDPNHEFAGIIHMSAPEQTLSEKLNEAFGKVDQQMQARVRQIFDKKVTNPVQSLVPILYNGWTQKLELAEKHDALARGLPAAP